MSAMASALQNNSPMLVLGGRAPAMRWGQGSLQEIDHVPFVDPVTKSARTAQSTDVIPGLVDVALAEAMTAPTRADVRGLPARPRVHGGHRAGRRPARAADPGGGPAGRGRGARGRAAARGRAPGDHGRDRTCTGRHGEDALRELVETRGIPVFLNGLARGCMPADHELFFSRARGRPR